MSKKPEAQPNETRITRFLHVVEWLGNALPHPVSLFALFAAGQASSVTSTYLSSTRDLSVPRAEQIMD